MKTDLPKYRELTELSDDLFSVVPSSWRLKRLKFLMPEVTVGIVITPSKYYAEKGVPAIRSLNVKRGKLIVTDLVFFSEKDNEKLKKTQIYKGDVVIVRSGLTGASAVVDSRFDGCNCIDLIIVRKSKKLDSHYLQYLLMSKEVQAQVFMSSNGAIQQHFNIGLVRELLILEPPKEDQKVIVTFLNIETSKIDQLMAVRSEQIGYLQEQRMAVIHHAVTKGLDPNVQITPSGVEWIGKIPAHWKIHRMRRTTSHPVNGIWGEEEAGSEDDIICLRVADFNRQTRRITDGNKTLRRISRSKQEGRILKLGDLLLEKSGGGEQQPVGCVVLFDKSYKAVTSNFVAKLTPSAQFDSRFLCYVHQALYESGVAKLSIKQTTGIQNLDAYWYLSEQAAFPDYLEQQKIADHLDYETSKIDALVAKYNSELELLEEYRTSIISHAVTGKIDVRGLVESTEPTFAEAL